MPPKRTKQPPEPRRITRAEQALWLNLSLRLDAQLRLCLAHARWRASWSQEDRDREDRREAAYEAKQRRKQAKRARKSS